LPKAASAAAIPPTPHSEAPSGANAENSCPPGIQVHGPDIIIMTTLRSAILVSLMFPLAACSAGDDKEAAMETSQEAPAEPAGKVVKSDEEWKKLLSPEQFHILREAGTERPNGKVYKEFKAQGSGTYHCAGCGALLFSSKEKFDSGCGWPSFYDPAKAENVSIRVDKSLGMVRTEVVCAKCDGHLGHVFEGEGFETPTDKRYCINGVGLKFVPAKDGGDSAASDKSAKGQGEAEDKSGAKGSD
jgi:peptide-methionine (R)-S-oxide reductase